MKRRRKKKRNTHTRKRRGKSRSGLWIGAAAVVVVIVASGLGYLLFKPEVKPVATGPPNVLLVTIDAIRTDRLGCYGAKDARTPTLDRLASVGARYTRCYAPAPLSRVSHASILTGLYPFYHGLHGGVDAGLDDKAKTLAEFLHDAGYETAAFVGSGGLHSRYGFAQGFDTYDGELSAHSITGRTQYAERAAGAVTNAALDWLTDTPRNKRTFVWVHYVDPQFPYAPPGYHPTGADENPYNLEVTNVDTQLGRLLSLIDERDKASGRITLAVVVGSCGEALFDHGEPTHGLFLYNEDLHVPLIVTGSAALPPAAEIDADVSLVDVLPSILSWVSISTDRKFNGRVLPAQNDESDVPIYFESEYPYVEYGWSPLEGVLVGDGKLISGPVPEYYDLREDPKEERNQYDTDRTAADALAKTLADLKSTALGYPRLGPVAVEPEASDPAYRAAAATSSDSAALADPKSRIVLHRDICDVRALLADGKPTDAVANLRELLTKDDGNRRALELLLRLCDVDDAREDALEVLRQREFAGAHWEPPFDLLVHRRLGIASLNAGQAREAGRLLDLAVAADPNDAASHFHLAQAMEQSTTGDSLSEFRKAVELEPTNTQYVLAATDRLERAGRYDDATEIYDVALNAAPDDPDLLAASSWTIFKSDGDKDLALKRAKRALEERPGQAKYQHALAVALIWNGQHDEAAALLKSAVSADMDYAQNILHKYESEGEFELVGTLYDLLLADHPDNVGILNNSAWSDYTLRRRPDRALERAQRAVELAPNVPGVHVTLGAVLIWQNRASEAITHLTYAIRANSRNASACYFLGRALQAMGETAAAVEPFRRAVLLADQDAPPDWLEDAKKRLKDLGAKSG